MQATIDVAAERSKAIPGSGDDVEQPSGATAEVSRGGCGSSSPLGRPSSDRPYSGQPACGVLSVLWLSVVNLLSCAVWVWDTTKRDDGGGGCGGGVLPLLVLAGRAESDLTRKISLDGSDE